MVIAYAGAEPWTDTKRFELSALPQRGGPDILGREARAGGWDVNEEPVRAVPPDACESFDDFAQSSFVPL
jgi:hypothetical protein